MLSSFIHLNIIPTQQHGFVPCVEFIDFNIIVTLQYGFANSKKRNSVCFLANKVEILYK